MEEGRFWKASEQDFRAALEKDISQWVEKPQFVKTADDEYALRAWYKS